MDLLCEDDMDRPAHHTHHQSKNLPSMSDTVPHLPHYCSLCYTLTHVLDCRSLSLLLVVSLLPILEQLDLLAHLGTFSQPSRCGGKLILSHLLTLQSVLSVTFFDLG